jgi:putative transposase
MQSLGRFYVRYFNDAYHRTGTLWEGRYKSTLVDAEHYFLIVSRYIELNPVRANMVAHPSEYVWSSYQHNVGYKTITLITAHDIYTRLSITVIQQQKAYTDLFKNVIDEQKTNEIQQATNKAWVLGNERFKEQIATLTDRRISPLPKGGDRRSKLFKERK